MNKYTILSIAAFLHSSVIRYLKKGRSVKRFVE